MKILFTKNIDQAIIISKELGEDISVDCVIEVRPNLF
jgi:hypothetical protein